MRKVDMHVLPVNGEWRVREEDGDTDYANVDDMELAIRVAVRLAKIRGTDVIRYDDTGKAVERIDCSFNTGFRRKAI